MNTINVSRIATNYEKIDNEKYTLLLTLAASEKGSSHFKYYSKRDTYRKSLEIINSIDNKKVSCSNDSITKFYRYTTEFNSNTEKQVFINNFLFEDNNFIHAMEICNIDIENIEKLIEKIKEKKKEAKLTKEYNLVIDNIIDLNGIEKFYNFSNKEIIINMMIELYTLRKELFKSKTKVKK